MDLEDAPFLLLPDGPSGELRRMNVRDIKALWHLELEGVYRPVKDSFVTRKGVISEYGVHPNNMALARAVEGDKSDNLPGVKGVGIKTLVKNFPELGDEEYISVGELVEKCRKMEKKTKFHEKMIQNKQIMLDNFKIMQLYSPSIPINVMDEIKSTYREKNSYSKMSFDKMLLKDGIGAYDWTIIRLFARKAMRK